MIGLRVGQKAHPAEVDAEQGHGTPHQTAGHTQHGAVAAEHDHEIEFLIIGGIFASGLNQRRHMPVYAQPLQDLATELPGAFMVGLADQKYMTADYILHERQVTLSGP